MKKRITHSAFFFAIGFLFVSLSPVHAATFYDTFTGHGTLYPVTNTTRTATFTGTSTNAVIQSGDFSYWKPSANIDANAFLVPICYNTSATETTLRLKLRQFTGTPNYYEGELQPIYTEYTTSSLIAACGTDSYNLITTLTSSTITLRTDRVYTLETESTNLKWMGETNPNTYPAPHALKIYEEVSSTPSFSGAAQLKANASTTISESATTTENTVVFRAILNSSSSNSLEFQVEVRASSTAFTNQLTASSTAVSPGATGTVTVSSLADGAYHWQGRVRDRVTNATSSWQEFGTVGNVDFVVALPPPPVGLVYDTLTSVGTLYGNTYNNHTVTFAGQDHLIIDSGDYSYWHPDATMQIDTISLPLCDKNTYSAREFYLQLKQFTSYPGGSGTLDATFDSDHYTLTPPLCSTNTNSPVTFRFPATTTLLTTKSYTLEYARVGGSIDAETSPMSETNPNAYPAKQAMRMSFSLPSITLNNQFKSDATTTIAAAATTTESWVVFGATLHNPGTSTVQLQVEVQPAGTNFTGTPNASSSFVTSGTYATTTFGTSSLIYPRDPESWSNGAFHWQARAKDSTGATSTWQRFGATTSSTDFVINTVPLYVQKYGPWPSYASTTSWNAETYADGSFYCGNGNTIGYCGCAITSVVEWMRYWGITTDSEGNEVNPKNLNTWLTNNGGYNAAGELKWNKITLYASSSSGGAIIYDLLSDAYGSSTSQLWSRVNTNVVSSTPNPVILFQANAPSGTSTIEHFVLATGSAFNNGTSTYTIRDSVWYDTKYLNQSTSTNVNAYSNNIDRVRIYYDPPQPPLWGEYHVSLPNALMLIDSQGRRTGKDPVSGMLYREIPNTSYGELGKSGQLFTSDLPDGKYSLYVLGGKTGSYWLDASHLGQADQKFYGNIEIGSVAAYTQNYDTTKLASSTFSYRITTSTTASITSAPAQNLPLPLLPILPVNPSLEVVPAPTIPTITLPTSTAPTGTSTPTWNATISTSTQMTSSSESQ